MNGHKYPGGRPVRKQVTVGPRIWRIPDDGPVTPRLRVPDKLTYAIGFRVETGHGDYFSDDKKK